MEQPNTPEPSRLDTILHAFFLHRMSLWLWISVALLVAIFFLARHMIGVALFKLALMTIAMYVGYAGSLAVEGALGLRASSRRKRPHEYQADAQDFRDCADGVDEGMSDMDRATARGRAWELDQLAAAMLWRRAMIVSAALIASALGG
jgi:hypothetical protein